MNRGRRIEPRGDCDYCNNPLPALRHPNTKYCNAICRQRDRYQREHGTGIKCLDCKKLFTRVGSHVVQIHGYDSVNEYRKEHGLMAKETHTEEHAAKMRNKVTEEAISNLGSGSQNRFVKGGDHADNVREFWANRKSKKGYIETNTPLGNR